jgi:hypothetical protein
MAKTVPIIGVDPDELRWMRLLVSLLRHPDPYIPELARQALLYVTEAARKCSIPPSDSSSPSTAGDNSYGSGQNLVS